MRVCLILEGTYPFVRGGVSAWTHQLIQALPEIEFYLLTISPKANQTAAYDLPQNVIGMQDIVVATTDTESPSVSTTEAEARLTTLRAQLDRNVHPLIEQLLDELEAAAGLNPFAVRAAGVPHATMRRFWYRLVERYRAENPYYALGEYFWTWFNSRAPLIRLMRTMVPDADVYHALCTGYAGFLGVVARAVTGKPLMLTEHGIYHRERAIEIESSTALRGRQRDLWVDTFYALSRLTYASADRIITLFEANRRLELSFGAPAERSLVIPNGIDLPAFRAVRRERRSGFHVGLVGRIVPIKDVKTFIVAARNVTERVADARFYCIGPLDEAEAYVDECRDLVRALGLDEHFEFTGQQDVRQYYGFLNVVVLSSLSEAQPLVILEALAAGTPVVATRVGDVPGLLGDEDRFIALPKDAEGIARRIVDIHANQDSVSQWVASRQPILDSTYNRDTIFGLYRDLYREVAWRE